MSSKVRDEFPGAVLLILAMISVALLLLQGFSWSISGLVALVILGMRGRRSAAIEL